MIAWFVLGIAAGVVLTLFGAVLLMALTEPHVHDRSCWP